MSTTVKSEVNNKTMMREEDEVPMLRVGDLDKDKEAKGMYGQSMKKKKKK